MSRLISALDIEFNQPSTKIISVGLILGDLDTGEIVEQKQWFVTIDEPVSKYIEKLTGISDAILNTQGQPLPEVYEELKIMHSKAHYKNPVTWGAGDSEHLMKELKNDYGYKFSEGYENPEKLEIFTFGHRSFDTKQIFQIECIKDNKGLQSGLPKAMCRCGLQFQGRKHTAIDDAKNTFLFFYYLLNTYQKGDIRK